MVSGGVTADSTYSAMSRSGLNKINVSLFNSDKDNIAYTALAATEQKSHCVMPEQAEVAWNFIKKFSRQADGTIKEIKSSTETTNGWENTGSNDTSYIENGYTVTGSKLIDNEWYLFDSNGKMKTG